MCRTVTLPVSDGTCRISIPDAAGPRKYPPVLLRLVTPNNQRDSEYNELQMREILAPVQQEAAVNPALQPLPESIRRVVESRTLERAPTLRALLTYLWRNSAEPTQRVVRSPPRRWAAARPSTPEPTPPSGSRSPDCASGWKNSTSKRAKTVRSGSSFRWAPTRSNSNPWRSPAPSRCWNRRREPSSCRRPPTGGCFGPASP